MHAFINSLLYKMLKVNLPGMYSDSPQKQTAPEDFYVDSSHETVQRLHHAYRHDFRYVTFLLNITDDFASEFSVILHSASTKSLQEPRQKYSEQDEDVKLN